MPHESLLEIDLNQLEKECQINPQLSYDWGIKLARAKRAAQECKNSLKVLEAKLRKLFCADPEKYGLSKTTEDSLKAAIYEYEEYQVRYGMLLELEEIQDKLQAFVYAVNDRKQQLENIVNLHGQMYWSKPQLSREQVQQQRARTMRDMEVNEPKV